MSPVWWGLHDILVPRWIQYTVPQDPPKIKNKLITIFYQITSIFYMFEDSFWSEIYFKICMGPWIIYKKMYEFCWPMHSDLGDRGINLRLRATEQSSLMKLWLIWTSIAVDGNCFMMNHIFYYTFSHFTVITFFAWWFLCARRWSVL